MGLANLRTAYETLKRETEWIKTAGIDRARFEALSENAARWDALQRDPVGYYRQLGVELQGVPEYAQALAPPKDDPEPGPDFFTMVNGERVEMFSAKAQKAWREWQDRQLDARLEQRINPLTGWVNEAQRQAVLGQVRQNSRSEAAEAMAELRQNPHFGPNEKKVAEKLASMPKEFKTKVGAIAALHIAWNQVFREHVIPTLESAVEKKVREETERKAAAASGNAGHSNGSGQAGAATRPSNVQSLAAKMASGAYNKT